MFGRTPHALVVSCLGLMAFAASAAAQRAPITYAGQGGGASTVTETASLGASALSGGDDNSYGYGDAQRRAGGAVIDLRRPTAQRGEPVVFEQPASQAHDEEEEESSGPVSLLPPTPQQTQQFTQREPVAGQGPEAWLERERVGPPYEANGRWYVPTPEPGYEQTGTASWYGPQFDGQRTASGETFDQHALTAAHPTLPIPSLVQVTNLENGREVIVRVNDRGPFVDERLIDMSRGAADALGFEQAGQARVHVRYLGPAPRRVNADGAPAPASRQLPAAPAPAQEEAPRWPPPPAPGSELAGAPVVGQQPVYSPAPPMGDYFVQVGAYSDPSNAHRVRDAVSAAGPVLLDVRRTAAGAELFRVRIGPWGSVQEANQARAAVAALGYGESVVASR
jgi:rare lipoprotein A